jgi:hypothetical protein
MSQYQIELMAVIRYSNPDMPLEELQAKTIELHAQIIAALQYNREMGGKK